MWLRHKIIFNFSFIVRNGPSQESKESLLNPGISNFLEPESSKRPENQEKKIWTRGEFTHQNSGIVESDYSGQYKYKWELVVYI